MFKIQSHKKMRNFLYDINFYMYLTTKEFYDFKKNSKYQIYSYFFNVF